MDRPKVITSFVRSKVGFYLTWLEFQKRKMKKKLFYIYENNSSKYVPTDMCTYPQT